MERETSGVAAGLAKSRGGDINQLAMIGLLAGGIAHDFNNILNMIRCTASLLLLKLPPESPLFDRLQDIDEQARSGSELTREIMGLMRNDDVEKQTLELNDVIGRSSSFFGRTKKNIKIERTFQPGLWKVKGNRQQIERVLLNLFVNAAQAMPQGGYIRIETSNLDYLPAEGRMKVDMPPGRYVRVSIADTGIGMSPEILASIFRPFASTKKAQGGSGLGLWSAIRIMEKYGGAITAESLPGMGATFNLFFPATDTD